MTEKEKMHLAIEEYNRILMDGADGLFRGWLDSHFVDCDPEKKTLTLAYDMTSWSSNFRGVTHGGMIASVFDQCMGILAFWCANGTVSQTVNMMITYLKPVPLESRLVIESTCSSAGRTLGNFTAKAWLEGAEDVIVATATSTFYSKK